LKRCMNRKFRGRSAVLVLTGMALLLAGVLAPGAQARVDGFQSLAPSSVPLTAVATDPGSGLIYAQENHGESFFVYNPQNDAWSELAPAPLDSGNNGGAAYLGGKIYVVYTSNSTKLAVYDIASNSWSTIANPLGAGSGNITAGNGKLYLVVDFKFVSYDPATGITTPLAEPPKFIPAQVAPAECDEGFEEWGGLQFDGSKIYGHQGNGCTGFAVYDIPSNTWLELPLVPELEEEGAVLGSAINPITNTYLTSGPYGGETLYRYDIEGNSWSTATLLPFEIEDGGMAYVSLPGREGVYIIQGEEGTGFTRYTEKNSTDLSPSMSAGAVISKKSGEITYSIQVKNNGPERASGIALSDSLPAGTSLISAGTSQGTCAGTSTLVCSLGILRSGESASLTIKLKTGFGTITNTATVSSQAVDTNAGNDSASVVTTLQPCVVPKLKKLRLKKAKKALRAAHCKPGKVKHRFSRKTKKGRVLHSGKHRGAMLPAGAKVNLTVSRGAKHKQHGKSKGRH
jgi:uncharacterized repeat protein (TIGR01451 family)